MFTQLDLYNYYYIVGLGYR